ncbi:MAG: M20/M25/M40 family metallo-hydrolase [Planctomycetes bacterium]|nr:M20/M25/M40 family metallo-hydrolase [Planctomycetota bacterium]
MPQRNCIHAAALAVALCLAPRLAAQDPVHHELDVTLHPEHHRLEVTDVLRLPPSLRAGAAREIVFELDAALAVESADPAFRVEAVEAVPPARRAGDVPVRRYRLVPGKEAGASAALRYAGVLHHPLVETEESARSFAQSPGLITAAGAVLSGASRWVPVFGDELVTFRMTVSLPAGWDAVSQGARTRHETAGGRRVVAWHCAAPMEEIHLVAAPFTEYSRPAGRVTAYAFLRAPDPNLAARYLEATAQYLALYDRLIGPYPFPKFALVENFWETGYGMPSFTLLGPKVLRFPFILHSSYPHEILHSWWGNAVFVEMAEGNWCEGLTAYLADHLIKEGRGQGAEYRRDALKKYLNHVRDRRDFPLAEFRERHSAATEAVGYGKALMVFHGLRQALGDDLFRVGLRRFYGLNRFRRASFDDLARAFAEGSGRDLGPFFAQWVARAGAPELAIAAVEAEPADGGFRVRVAVRQVQEGEVFRITVPVGLVLEGRREAVVVRLELDDREAALETVVPARPLRVALDPEFDVFRRLDRREIPPTVGQLFGAERLVLIVPAGGDAALRDAYRAAAETWVRGLAGRPRIVSEDELDALPADSAVWVLGSENRWREPVAAAVRDFGAGLDAAVVRFGAESVPRADHSFVFTAGHPEDPELAVGWIGADRPDALAGLARKLPHYGKYSWLGFAGAEPANVAKGEWPATGSPLMKDLESGRAVPSVVYPARRPLAALAAVFDPDRLMRHVRALAAEGMEGRGVGTGGLDQAADYVAAQFKAAGLEPGGEDGGYFQRWTEPEGPGGREVALRNVVGVLPGRKAGWEAQSVVIGAHYDHLGRGWPDVRAGEEGKIHPGADDNASGVAVLIEAAALLARELVPERTLVFVAFAGEEWGLKGSRHYMRAARRRPAAEILAMVNLDSVGRLEGRKLLVLGGASAREWAHIARGVGLTTGVETTVVADDFGASDQRSFHEAGVPAIQVFAGMHPDYHRPTDTPDRVDPAGLVQAATFVREVAVYLAARTDPLTTTLAAGGEVGPQPAAAGAQRGERRVSLGTMPDLAYPGPGVRIADVIDGTPAARAGLRAGDLILAIDGRELRSLRDYAAALRARSPGDEIALRVRRGEEELALKATLVQR